MLLHNCIILNHNLIERKPPSPHPNFDPVNRTKIEVTIFRLLWDEKLD